jgi:hypothetical protein
VVQELKLKMSPQDEESTQFHQIVLAARSTNFDPFSTSDRCLGAHIQISALRVENRLMRLESASLSGVLHDTKANSIHQLSFAVANAIIVAGFSSIDWSNMFGTHDQESVSVLIPFSRLEAFTAHLTYSGALVATHDSICVPAFQGGPHTTSKDVIQHITSAVLSKAPSLISNAEVLGENVLEMAGKSAGRVALAASMTGSAAGSIIGLAAVDSIKGAIASGKKSRNASTNEKYCPGDLTRGLIHSVKQAAKSGGDSRRGFGGGDSYRVGDFSVGAAKSVAKYTTENESRLVTAGASGVGMAIGTAVAGPLGFVAGGYLGSKLGASSFKDSSAPKRGKWNTKGHIVSTLVFLTISVFFCQMTRILSAKQII